MSERLRVLALVDGLVAGGGEAFARELTIHLDPARFERALCVTRWSEEIARRPAVEAARDELRDAGVELHMLTRRSRLSLTAWRPLVRMLRSGRVDILHAHKFGSNVWAALFGPSAGVPVVLAHEQTWSYEGQWLRRLLDRQLIARRVDRFLCVSSEDRRRMIEVERVPAEKIILVPNAVPTNPPTPGRDIRSELGIGSEDLVVGTVCMLRPQKALDVLLRAAAIVRDKRPAMRVVIVGDGEERERLEALSAELGIAERVEFLGRRTDVSDVLTAFDVAVSSSDFEGTPLAVMEFMEASLPIAATRVGGTPELIDDGIHGLLVPPQDPDALASAIGRLLDDRDTAASLGSRARERRRREFEIGAVAARVGDLYESLYASSRRRR